MLNKKILLFILLMAPVPIHAVTLQTILGHTDDNSSASATEYISIASNTGENYNNILNNHDFLISTDVTFKSLEVTIDTQPGAVSSANQYVFDLLKNGVATGLTITLFETETTELVTADVDLAPGDLVAIRITPSSTPDTFGEVWTNIICQPDTDDEYIYGLTADDVPSRTATEYAAAHGAGDANSFSSTEDSRSQLVPTPGTIRNLYLDSSNALAGSDTYDISIRKNLAATGDLTTQLTSASQQANSGVNTMTVAAGDILALESIPTGNPSATRMRVGWTFIPDTTGEQIELGGTDTPLNSSTTEFVEIFNSKPNGWQAPVGTNTKIFFDSRTIQDLYVRLDGDPGVAPNDYTFTVMKNGVATSLAVTINTSSTDFKEVDNSTTVDYVDGDTISLRSVPTSTPSIVDAKWGIVVKEPAGAETFRRRVIVSG